MAIGVRDWRAGTNTGSRDSVAMCAVAHSD